MKIIGGEYKGRRIVMPSGIRPTRDNVREAIFNILAARMEGSRVLDLFAGSGAFGIEALSRGAHSAVFIDDSCTCTDIITKNIRSFSLEGTGHSEVYTKNSLVAIKYLHKRKEIFDIVFLDPPYYKGWAKKSLKYLDLYDILAPSGLVIIEHFKRDDVPSHAGKLMQVRRLAYGDTAISIYKSIKEREVKP